MEVYEPRLKTFLGMLEGEESKLAGSGITEDMANMHLGGDKGRDYQDASTADAGKAGRPSPE